MKLNSIAETTQRQPTSWATWAADCRSRDGSISLFCAAGAHSGGCSSPQCSAIAATSGPVGTAGFASVNYSPQAESPCNPGVPLPSLAFRHRIRTFGWASMYAGELRWARHVLVQ
jgi:hypothetical protein